MIINRNKISQLLIISILILMVIALLFNRKNTSASSDILIVDPNNSELEYVLNSVEIVAQPPFRLMTSVSGIDKEKMPTDRPVAMLPEKLQPESINVTATFFPDLTGFYESHESKPEQIGFAIPTSVAYDIEEYKVYVSTVAPSPAALERPMLLGIKQQISKTSGKEFWLTDGQGIDTSRTPNEVVFIEDGLIIALAGTLPIERMVELAEQVVIVR